MMLVEEGKVDLDAPASKYLPALANRQVITSLNAVDGTYKAVPAKNRHDRAPTCSRTPRAWATASPATSSNTLTKGDFSVRATAFPLLFEPGTQWHYGESTAVLGEIVEAVSGKELSVFLQERLLGPLRMTDTTFDVSAEKNARVVTVHQRNGTTMTETPNPPGVISAPHRGDGGLSATARRLLEVHPVDPERRPRPGGARLLKPATVKLMGQNHTAPVKVPLMHSTNKGLSEDFPAGRRRGQLRAGLPAHRSPGARHAISGFAGVGRHLQHRVLD